MTADCDRPEDQRRDQNHDQHDDPHDDSHNVWPDGPISFERRQEVQDVVRLWASIAGVVPSVTLAT